MDNTVDLGDFLNTEVYPALDAVQAGFLDDLSPKQSTRSYSLDCPACSARGRAFYYPGSSFIVCNRKGSCGEATSIWSHLKDSKQLKGREVLELLCREVGKEIPSDDRNTKSGFSKEHKATSTLKRILTNALHENDAALTYLQDRRKLTEKQIHSLELGFYPSEPKVRGLLADAGVDLQVAQSLGYIAEPGKPFRMANRVVGFWKEDNGSSRLWGRAIGDETPKYLFSTGSSKTKPLGFATTKGILFCVEGVFDYISLHLLGIPSCATAGNCINSEQAAFMASQGIEHVLFLTDAGDAAVQGVLTTIANCEPLGITTYFASVPEGADDIDALRKAGRKDEIHSLIENSVTGGEYLVAFQLRMLDLPKTELAKQSRKLERVVKALGNVSAAHYQSTLKRVGLNLLSTEEQALKMMATLCDYGCSVQQAREIVSRRFGIELTVGTDECPVTKA